MAQRSHLINRLVPLKRGLISGDSTFAADISQLESETKALISREFEVSKIRSSVQWFEEGDRPTSYFFKLQHALPEIFITSFLAATDLEVFAREEIERAHVRFFSELSSEAPIDAA